MATSSNTSFKDSPFLAVMKETNQLPEARRQPLIAKLEGHFNAKVVSFFTSFNDQRVMITDTDAEMLESMLSAEHAGGKLLLIVNSPGGDALAAERIANVCRAYSGGDFEVLVPHMAKSAATMIAFGASKIYMSKTSELGPVDPQVPYWGESATEDADPNWISAEEYVRSYDNLMRAATNGRAKRLEPYLQQLNIYDARFIESLRSVQKLSADISVQLLKTSMMKSKSTREIRKKIDVFLTQTKTSSHGRMISAAEATACGLKISMIDLQTDVWRDVWELFVRSDWFVRKRHGKILETSKSAVSAS